MGVLPLLFITYLLLYGSFSDRTLWHFVAALALLSILLGFTLLRQSADQLHNLARKTATVDYSPEMSAINLEVEGELQDIATNFNILLDRLNNANRDIQDQSIQLIEYARDLSLSYEKIKQEEEIRKNLCRYISSDLVEELVGSEKGSLLHNQRKTVTVMFADIRSFTALAEQMEPEEVVSMLNQYFSRMVDIVFRYNGMLDKFVGDQLMAVFGHISDEKQGANDAVLAALEMHEAVQELMQIRATQRLLTFKIGIGINTGSAIFAHVGSENRKDYTVIGDAVNTASRLEKFAQGGEIVIGQQTCDHLSGCIQVGRRADLKVKNRSKPVACYKVLTAEELAA